MSRFGFPLPAPERSFATQTVWQIRRVAGRCPKYLKILRAYSCQSLSMYAILLAGGAHYGNDERFSSRPDERVGGIPDREWSLQQRQRLYSRSDSSRSGISGQA